MNVCQLEAVSLGISGEIAVEITPPFPPLGWFLELPLGVWTFSFTVRWGLGVRLGGQTNTYPLLGEKAPHKRGVLRDPVGGHLFLFVEGVQSIVSSLVFLWVCLTVIVLTMQVIFASFKVSIQYVLKVNCVPTFRAPPPPQPPG